MLLDGSADFIKYDFAITQDLCKQFITVVTAVLVFSLTFSDKIVNFSAAKKYLRVLLGLSWASMLFAIIACGLGLTYICIAGGEAIYGHDGGYPIAASTSYKWIIAAGISQPVAPSSFSSGVRQGPDLSRPTGRLAADPRKRYIADSDKSSSLMSRAIEIKPVTGSRRSLGMSQIEKQARVKDGTFY